MSASVNKVLLMGHLGSDPELRYMAGGSPVASLSIATTERRRQLGEVVEDVEWHRVSLFGQEAEFARDYLHKGAAVFIEGRIRTETWRDREGRDRKTTTIVAHRLEALGSKVGRLEQAPDSAAPDVARMTSRPPPKPAQDDDIEYPF